MNEPTKPECIRLLRDLRAVREFAPDPVPAAFLADAAEVARWTGSARNLQPWRIVVIHTRATLDALATLPGHAQHLAGAPVGIALVMDNDNAEFAAYDEGRLAERLMLAALAHGLGSCIGWFAGEGREAAGRLLGAPAGTITRTVLAVGYPASAGGLKPRRQGGESRKPITEIIFQERIGA